MKSITNFLLLISVFYSFQSSAQKNLSLLSKVTYTVSCAGVWHYARDGREYALVGTRTGISIVDVTNQIAPQKLFALPSVSTLWHEVKVWGDYAYAVFDQGSDPSGVLNGLQIINLSYLPDSAPYRIWKGDSTIAGQLITGHAITADKGYVYINGHNIGARGVIIASLKDPWNPHFVGAETQRYCHDSYVRGDTLWTSDIFDGVFSVYNISNRGNPVLLATQQTPRQFNHNAWLSDNSHYLFTTDERCGAPVGSFDVSDLNSIQLVDLHYPSFMLCYNGTDNAEPHNVRVLNDFIINASYGSQVTLIDAAYPKKLIEVGNFPTGSYLCWDADPYLPSGNILATDDGANALYILKPTYVRACYLQGIVTDSITKLPLVNVSVNMLSTIVHDSSDITGHYTTGIADSSLYQVQFSKAGYKTKTISRNLSNGVLTQLNVELVPNNVGIGEVNSESLVKIKNNPSDNIMLEISEKAWTGSGELSLLISDELGKVVIQKSPLKEKSIFLGKNSLAAGNYYFTLERIIGNENHEVLSKGKLVVINSH